MQHFTEMSFTNMQVIWFLALGCLTVSSKANDLEFIEKDNRVDAENENAMKGLGDLFVPVNILLYTRRNPDISQKISGSHDDLDSSNFNASCPTKVIVHGFLQNSRTSDINKNLRRAYLSKGDYNFIFIEWPQAMTLNYSVSLRAVPRVGKKLAIFIDSLRRKYRKSLNSIHLVGHSLGAHICGYAGKYLRTGPVGKITALDPAAGGFTYENAATRLNYNDADFVVSFQTDAGRFGLMEPIGWVTLYFNGGESQPGCHTNFCNHERSVYYKEETIKNNKVFSGARCPDYKSAIANKCGDQFSTLVLGDDQSKPLQRTIYYVPTTSESPYGILPN